METLGTSGVSVTVVHCICVKETKLFQQETALLHENKKMLCPEEKAVLSQPCVASFHILLVGKVYMKHISELLPFVGKYKICNLFSSVH